MGLMLKAVGIMHKNFEKWLRGGNNHLFIKMLDRWKGRTWIFIVAQIVKYPHVPNQMLKYKNNQKMDFKADSALVVLVSTNFV